MLTHSKGMIDSWADGDPGKAVGNAMLFSAATLAASAALVESLSMVGLIASSSATSFAGPVGIIVALVTIGATIVIWKYAKSDLFWAMNMGKAQQARNMPVECNLRTGTGGLVSMLLKAITYIT